MRYLIVAVLFAALTGLLLYLPAGSDAQVPQGRIVAQLEDTSPATAIVCCTFEQDGRTRTCAAVEGQSCAICDAVC